MASATIICSHDGFANLRTGPGTHFPIVVPVYNVTPIDVLQGGVWAFVRIPIGAFNDVERYGYIRSNLISSLPGGYRCDGSRLRHD
jgi:hypothetical protein